MSLRVRYYKSAITWTVLWMLGLVLLMAGCQMSYESSGRDITFDISPDGTQIVFPGVGKGVRDLYLLDLKTYKVTRLTETESWETQPRFSPDGRSIVYSAWTDPKQEDHYWNLYLLDLETRQIRQLTYGRVGDSEPQFTPDGKYIVFSRATRLRKRSMGGKAWSDGNVCAIELEKENPEVINLPIDFLSISDINKDGKALVLGENVLEGGYPKNSYVLIDLLATLKEGKLKAIQVPPREHLGWIIGGSWSPNGNYVAYIRGDGDGRWGGWVAQVDLQNAQELNRQRLTDLGTYLECPRFASDNATIYFLKLETDLVSKKWGIWRVNKDTKVCEQVADYTLFDNPLGWKPKR